MIRFLHGMESGKKGGKRNVRQERYYNFIRYVREFRNKVR